MSHTRSSDELLPSESVTQTQHYERSLVPEHIITPEIHSELTTNISVTPPEHHILVTDETPEYQPVTSVPNLDGNLLSPLSTNPNEALEVHTNVLSDNGLGPAVDTSMDAHINPSNGEVNPSDGLQQDSGSAGLPLPSDQHSAQVIPHILNLPITNSQGPLTLSDMLGDNGVTDPLSPELASADISIASDGSFVETSSGPAARELKRRYDQQYGVGMSVRSPYAITAFVNQHGKQMYRVSHRELSAPAASAADVEDRIVQAKTSSEASTSPRAKRRSRMSMHSFLPPAIFPKNTSTISKAQAGPSQSSGARKLRKTRSIPDMVNLSAADTSSASQSHQPGSFSPVTGRVHSHSVTAADISRFPMISSQYNPVRNVDFFSELMDWSSTVSNASSASFSNPGVQHGNITTEHSQSRPIIVQPFGPGVSFDAPSRKPPADFLPTPRILREMQSFESGRTATQADQQPFELSNPDTPTETETHEVSLTDITISRPPSVFHLRDSITPIRNQFQADPVEREPTPDTLSAPSLETSSISHYSTDVFDTLQNYRGLPLLDKLTEDSEETTVIKMSISADDSAAPRDDPRFVIWGEIQVDWDQDDQSVSRESFDMSLQAPSLSKRRNSKIPKTKSPEIPNVRLSVAANTEKVLIAATIERWIAQLTSELKYDELLDFFLTYRTYVSAVDLCHLLICRFHWTLQKPTSNRDGTVRRIVRVRTFVAIRYWLLTFFTVDFLPNRELRLLVAKWLNTLVRDPILTKYADGLGVVRRLIKICRECKRTHTRLIVPPKPRAPTKPHVLGEKFAEATRQIGTEDDDSDLDLDFVVEETFPNNVNSSPDDPANAHLTKAHVGAGISPTRPVSLPLSSFNVLQRTEHPTGSSTEVDSSFIQPPATIPIHHSALSRAFVKTIGRLGRWTRVLNPRGIGRPPLTPCANVSAFDLDLAVSRDLLTVNGGVEHYLKMSENSTATNSQRQQSLVPLPTQPVLRLPRLSTAPISPTATEPTTNPQTLNATESHEVPSQDATQTEDVADGSSVTAVSTLSTNTRDSVSPPPHHDEALEPPTPISPPAELERPPSANNLTSDEEPISSNGRAESFRSSSTDSFGIPLSDNGPNRMFPNPNNPQRQLDVVSIDDLDLSDASSEVHENEPAMPPGLSRKPLRKLPMRRDFEFVRRSQTVSSMGIVSRESMGSGPSSSVVSSASFKGLGAGIEQWQMNFLLDRLSDEEEVGDIEATLRQLEGQTNPEKQQERAIKVEGWVRTIQERMAGGDFEHEEPRFPYSDDEDEDEDDLPEVSPSDQPPVKEESAESVHTPIPPQSAHSISSSSSSPTQQESPSPEEMNSRLATNDAPDIPQASQPNENIGVSLSVPSLPFSVAAPPMFRNPVSMSMTIPIVKSQFGNPELPSIHRSFVLNYRAEALAKHFSMIDRELFMSVKFEELVLDDWTHSQPLNVLDWAQYLKDKARWKLDAASSDKASALAAVRARFNLMSNFVISEIFLTQPSERPLVVAKFIRVAWKAYALSNFHTLTAIITALQSDWVNNAMRRSAWNRVGSFETRVLQSLKQFTANAEDFKFMRLAVNAINDAKPIETASHTISIISSTEQSSKAKAGTDKPPVPLACIPFIGIYLSQLHRFSKLPDLIDPTAPNEAVWIDPITANFDPPSHPEVFSSLAPLPASMHLEPLINVHKQRKIAAVIKSLVAGQHLASRVKFDIDRRLFQKCLRLRGMDTDMLQRALAMYPD